MISYHTCPLASHSGKETGGMNVYVFELSKKLSEHGVYVDIFTRSESSTHEAVVQVNPHMRVIHITAGPQTHLSKKKIDTYIDTFTDGIADFSSAQSMQYEIIHAHYYLSGLIAIKLKKSFRKSPIVMTFHTLGLMKNLVARDTLESETAERIKAEMSLVHEVDYIIALSESDKEYITYLYNGDPKKISVITPGVDVDFFKPIDKKIARQKINADPNHRLILFVGRIEPLKGIDSLLYAIKILLRRNPHFATDVCLWIVGGDVSQKKQLWSHELQKLEELRQVLNIKTSVHFVGQKDQSDLPYYYSSADIVVMPSHYETFGMVALEAMASGIPVISTHVAGISGLIDKKRDSLIVPANSPLHLASQIELLLTDKELYERSRLEVIEKVHTLSWNHVARKMKEAYNNFLNG